MWKIAQKANYNFESLLGCLERMSGSLKSAIWAHPYKNFKSNRMYLRRSPAAREHMKAPIRWRLKELALLDQCCLYSTERRLTHIRVWDGLAHLVVLHGEVCLVDHRSRWRIHSQWLQVWNSEPFSEQKGRIYPRLCWSILIEGGTVRKAKRTREVRSVQVW